MESGTEAQVKAWEKRNEGLEEEKVGQVKKQKQQFIREA